MTNAGIEAFLIVCKQHSISKAAAELFISEDTVKAHTRNLYKKLGVHSKKDVQALFDDGSPLKG